MAQAHVNDDLMVDREVRDSIMVIRRQRSMKLALAIGAIVAALIATFAFLYLSYSDQPESAKGLSGQVR